MDANPQPTNCSTSSGHQAATLGLAQDSRFSFVGSNTSNKLVLNYFGPFAANYFNILLQYFIVKFVPAQFHVSSCPPFICTYMLIEKICTVFYNKQFYVQQAGVVTSEKVDLH